LSYSSKPAAVLWRLAERTAEWCLTQFDGGRPIEVFGVLDTLLPHFRSQKEAEDKGLKPVEARRYADVHLFRNDEPTDPLVARLGEEGWFTVSDCNRPGSRRSDTRVMRKAGRTGAGCTSS
jgi:hypothetical protein